MTGIRTIILTALAVALTCGCSNRENRPAKVELKKNESGYHRLYVNNKEFYVEGAGLEFGNIEALASHGANSFRTWRTRNESEDALEVLNQAH